MKSDMNVELNYHISPVWELIEKVENKTKEALKIPDQELLSATLMVVTELLENAVKYGKSNPEIKGIEFNFTADDHQIVIRVTNMVITDSHAKEVMQHIDQVNRAKYPSLLYTKRLRELLKNTKKGESKLGIYRIAYEGKYNLTYEYKKNILSIIAKRAYSQGAEA